VAWRALEVQDSDGGRHHLAPPAFSGGSWDYPLGTDNLGRDVLSRIFVGARVSLSIGIVVVLLAGVVGTALGIVAGYYQRWIGSTIMRLVDVELAFPALLLALTILALAGASPRTIIIVLTINTWMIFCRITRDSVLAIRTTTYIEAAETVGCSPARIMWHHLLPNLAPALLTLSTLEFARVVLAEASLSYLGFGVQPPGTSWGLMIADGQKYVSSAWWTVTFPGVALAVTVLAINLVASWLRVMTDPRQRDRRMTVMTSTRDAL
jgi:peptide/nickel transport system permease protein